MKKNVLISLRLSENLYVQIKNVSAGKECSVATTVREALIYFLANKSNKDQ